MSENLCRFYWHSENGIDPERMRLYRIESTMRVCNCTERILDRFRRRLALERQDHVVVGEVT